MRRVFLIVLLCCALLLLGNISAFRTGGETRLIAHRGVHQVDRDEGGDAQTCRAGQIATFTHPFIENTLPSMRAAFEAEADMAEIDVQLRLTRSLRCSMTGRWTARPMAAF